MPDGKLHILTTRSSQNSGNTSSSGIVQSLQKSGTPKALTQATGASSSGTPNAIQTPVKSAVVVRQPIKKPTQANVIVKTVAQKPTMQRVNISKKTLSFVQSNIIKQHLSLSTSATSGYGKQQSNCSNNNTTKNSGGRTRTKNNYSKKSITESGRIANTKGVAYIVKFTTTSEPRHVFRSEDNLESVKCIRTTIHHFHVESAAGATDNSNAKSNHSATATDPRQSG